MITRDRDHNITITAEDIGPLAGFMGGAIPKMQSYIDSGQVPGSLLPLIESMLDSARALDKALTTRVE